MAQGNPKRTPHYLQVCSFHVRMFFVCSRKWNRGKAKKTMAERFPNPQKLKLTELHSHVICENKDLLYEEAPQAYKEVEGIIKDLQDNNLIKVVAILRPVRSPRPSLTVNARSHVSCAAYHIQNASRPLVAAALVLADLEIK
jgi:hypothetical protein